MQQVQRIRFEQVMSPQDLQNVCDWWVANEGYQLVYASGLCGVLEFQRQEGHDA